jgi:hypothetical protein
MFHAPMNTTFSILFIAATFSILLSASGHIFQNQQVFAANPGNVGHLYEGGVPGYPYFGGYPNYGRVALFFHTSLYKCSIDN